MCGFFAIIGPAGTLPDDDTCRRALATLSDRGPDGEGLHREILADHGLEVVFGHRRLAIVGVGNGTQPMLTEKTVSVVNGEFYGHEAVRQRLERQGARFTTDSDSEILPHLFEATRTSGATWPGAAMRQLCGEWAFALLDRDRGTLWAGCDPSGTKPLRWWRSADGQTLMLASQASTLFELGAPKAMDDEALRFAMGFQYLPYGRTPFGGIGMVPPGTWMASGGGMIATGQTWDHFRQAPVAMPDNSPAALFPWLGDGELQAIDLALRPGAPRSSKAQAIRALLEGAVARRIPRERDFCSHLSGGIDSAIVTALLIRQTGKPIQGFCASFPWAAQGDETEAALETATAIGAEFCPVLMQPRALLDAMSEAPRRAEGMAINMHAGAKILVADAIRAAGHRVAFTGEGADEAFLGYEHFRWDFPENERPVTRDVNPLSVGIMRPDGKPRASLASLEFELGSLPAWISTKMAAADQLTPTLGRRLQDLPFAPNRLLLDLPDLALASAVAVDPLARARALWSIYCMTGYILRGLDDAMGMARGVESRLVFLDPAIQWFAARIAPGEHYGADGIEKGLLREAVADLLPESVLRRPKRAFLAPSLFGSDVGMQWAQERLLDGPLASSGLFDRPGIEALLARPASPVRDAGILTLASLSGLMTALKVA